MTNKPDGSASALEHMLERTLLDIGIPPRPAIIDRIAQEMHKDDPDLKQLGHLIESDVSLSASLIKMANSPSFGFHRRVGSVNDALLLLGLNVSSRAIAGLSLRRAFPVVPVLERFWSASAHVATLAGWLARMIDKPRLRADEAYTYGLFRDCGIPVLLRRFPAYAQTLGRANKETQLDFTQVELQEFPTEHALVGCLLAQNWWLPQEICLAIRHHHDRRALDFTESGLPMVSRQMVAVGQTAEYILQQVTGLSQTCEWPKLSAFCLRQLDLTEEMLPALCLEAVEVIRTVE